MTNRNTKRALLVSVMAMLICVSMLVGTTFAWFTDTETSGKNIIKSGNLDVELSFYRPEDSKAPADLDDESIWKDIDGNTEVFDKGALWEPGYTQVVYFRVKNVGSLTLKYNLFESIYEEKAGINAANEIFYLSDYLYSYVDMNKDAATIEDIKTREAAVTLATNELGASRVDNITLLAGETNYGVMIVTMPTTVGNEANHLIGSDNQPVIGLGITLVATQEMYEEDSFGTDYDEDATYPKTFDVVDAAGLAEALAADNNGESKVIDLKADITVDAPMAVNGDVTFNFNGNTIDSTVAAGRIFQMTNDSSLTVNAEGETIEIGTDSYGVVEVPAGVDGATIVLNGGTYVGTTNNGAFIKVRPGADNVSITLNNVIYKDSDSIPTTADKNCFILNTYEYEGALDITVNGGEFTSAVGFQTSVGSKLTVDGAKVTTKSLGFEIAGKATITNTTVTIKNPGTTANKAPSACFAVSYGGSLEAKDCKTYIDNVGATMGCYVYSTGGSIVAENIGFGGSQKSYQKIDHVDGTITIDGTLYDYASLH